MTPSLTESQVYAALGDFICQVTGLTAHNVVRGQINRVPMAPGPNSFSVQANGRQLMATAESTFTPSTDPAPAPGTNAIGRSTNLYFQIDAYGPASGDNAQAVMQLFSDDYGTEFFRARGLGALYCEPPSQMPLIAGEQQYISRWMIRAALHAFIVVSAPQDFADTLVTTLSEITHAV